MDLARQLVAVLKPAPFQLDKVVFILVQSNSVLIFPLMHTRIKYVDICGHAGGYGAARIQIPKEIEPGM